MDDTPKKRPQPKKMVPAPKKDPFSYIFSETDNKMSIFLLRQAFEMAKLSSFNRCNTRNGTYISTAHINAVDRAFDILLMTDSVPARVSAPVISLIYRTQTAYNVGKHLDG